MVEEYKDVIYNFINPLTLFIDMSEDLNECVVVVYRLVRENLLLKQEAERMRNMVQRLQAKVGSLESLDKEEKEAAIER